MDFKGTIKAIKEVRLPNSEDMFLEVLLEENVAEYPNSMLVNVWGESVKNFQKFNKVGDNGTAQINSRAKKGKDGIRYFNSLTLWRFDKETQTVDTVTSW
tara:strand:+ start:34 stop:333 length:300 start_codon:yes stop_codon:yes gene_type:complete